MALQWFVFRDGMKSSGCICCDDGVGRGLWC